MRNILMRLTAGLLFWAIPALALGGSGTLNIKVTVPSNLIISVEFKDGSGDGALELGETGTLVIKVWNNGKGEAGNVKAVIRGDEGASGLRIPGPVDIGNIPPGKNITRQVNIGTGQGMNAGKAVLSIVVTDSTGFESQSVSTDIAIKAQKRPQLIVYDYGINDRNDNFKIEPLERVRLMVRVKNIGGGIAKGVRVNMATGKNVTVCGSGISTFDIGDIRAGDHKDVKFNFYADKKIKNGNRIPIDVEIFENRPEFNVIKSLDLFMGEKTKSSLDLKR